MGEPVRINVTVGADGRVSNALVFGVEDVRRLRELGVCGVLSGSLPTLAQQNVFLSVPLRLSGEEAVWLLEQGYGSASVTRPGTLARVLAEDEVVGRLASEACSRQQVEFERQRAYKREQHALKLQRLGIEAKSRREDRQLLESSLFCEVPNESAILRDEDAGSLRLVELLKRDYSNDGDYRVFASLKKRGLVVSPGARFGGKFIVYPGDPLRFHSHMVVSSPLDYRRDPIEFRDVFNGSRLSTTVKKIWVVSGIDLQEPVEDEQVKFFSIEWAGFG